jgi:hypothetical protein
MECNVSLIDFFEPVFSYHKPVSSWGNSANSVYSAVIRFRRVDNIRVDVHGLDFRVGNDLALWVGYLAIDRCACRLRRKICRTDANQQRNAQRGP